jgi:hypothetical protein
MFVLLEEIMKCAAEMGSGAMMYIPPRFKTTGSEIRKLFGGYTNRHTDSKEIL